ncbi:hypothetical protein [Ferrimonas marina]|uniref:Uncharacterized protein n=1 Tax=Ferrimonas marina TaxID=299255 RepID=A0A1M5Z4H3_9GAMM|nr:hypothetical protein [Ferrimonas marina]SHI19162.1 hypothetical protein SAMN02745129_4635 [Ferrimonas marina]
MIDMAVEFSPALMTTPVMSSIVTGLLTAGLLVWALIGYDYVRAETAPKLWQK